jgi:tetratricopeptide (TPR) repeat protein
LDGVKRLLGGIFLLVVCIASFYGYAATRRERLYRDFIGRGEAALATDDTSSAIEAFSGAIALKSDSMLGYLKRGETYARRNELDSALRDLRRAADLDPAAPRAAELLGDVNYRLGRFERAAERFEVYVALDDRSPRLFYKLGLARYRSGQVAAAATALQRAVALDDRFAEAYYLLGLCYRDQQKAAESQAALQRSVSLAPALLHAREELADLYGREGHADDRVTQLEALLALDPAPSREVALGLAYARAGRPDTAITTLSRAVERHPDHPQAYAALGRLWLERAQARGDRVELSKALGALAEAVGADQSSEVLTLYGRALFAAGDYEQAQRALTDATARMPVDPLSFYYLADIAERRADFAVALNALRDYQALEGQDLDEKRAEVLRARIAALSARVSKTKGH